jgi:hypothetical protein
LIVIKRIINIYAITMARCNECRKKMGVMEFTCKCEKKYCMKCLHPENHSCSYDFKNEGKKNLESHLVKVAHEKVIKI